MSDFYTIKDKKERKIQLEFDDHFVIASHNGIEIGGFDFKFIDFIHSSALLVTNMHLEKIDGYKMCGIGTKILNMASDYWGASIMFGEDDGTVSLDGSHLTGDGAGFAYRYLKPQASTES